MEDSTAESNCLQSIDKEGDDYTYSDMQDDSMSKIIFDISQGFCKMRLIFKILLIYGKKNEITIYGMHKRFCKKENIPMKKLFSSLDLY